MQDDGLWLVHGVQSSVSWAKVDKTFRLGIRLPGTGGDGKVLALVASEVHSRKVRSFCRKGKPIGQGLG